MKGDPLNTPCLCGHPLWLHTNGCIARIPAGRSQMCTAPCGCERTLLSITDGGAA